MNSFSQNIITYATAQRLVSAALKHAKSRGWSVAVAVCDPHGGLISFGKDDATAPPIGGFALDKAYTAATLRKSSAEFGAGMMKSATLSLGIGTRERLLTWAVACPFMSRGR